MMVCYYKDIIMKKIILILIFISTIVLAEDTYVEHELKMQEMRNSMSMQGSYDGTNNNSSKKQKRQRLQNGSKNGQCEGSGRGQGNGKGRGR